MRYAAAVALLAFVFSGCALGAPGAPTGVSQTGATLHASVYSSINGPTQAWFSYGQGTNPATWSDTQHQTIDVTTRNAYPLSAPLTGLSPGTTYNWRVCAQDAQTPKICTATQTFATDAQQEYVAMGDSLTQIGSATNQRYPERFFSFLDTNGGAGRLSNVGISGENSVSLLAGTPYGTQFANAKARINDPNTNTTVLTIDIGGNDLLNNCHPELSFNWEACQPAVQTFATNLDTILTQLDTALGNDPGAEQRIAIEYYNPWSGRPDFETADANAQVGLLGTDGTIDCDGTGTARGFNDVIACTAQDHGWKVADLLPPFTGHGDDYFFDDIHPNDPGHQVVADVLEDVYQAP